MIDLVKKFFGKMTKNGSPGAIGIIGVSVFHQVSACVPPADICKDYL